MAIPSLVRPLAREVVADLARYDGGRDGVIASATPPGPPSEYIGNGEFVTSDGWTLGAGWSIAGGEAVNSGSNAFIERALEAPLTIGVTYRLAIDYTGFPPSTLAAVFAEGAIPDWSNPESSPVRHDFVALQANARIKFRNEEFEAGAIQSASLTVLSP